MAYLVSFPKSRSRKNHHSPIQNQNNKTSDGFYPFHDYGIEDQFSTPKNKKIQNNINEIPTKKNDESLQNIQTQSPSKSKKIFGFVVKEGVFSEKKRRFFSPEETTRKDSTKNLNVITTKYKEIKQICQESEINLQKLYSKIKENKFSNGEKATLCLNMINSAFLINHENTNQFKEIGPILEKMIFCSKHIEDQLKSLFGEKIDLRDNTYCHMVSGLLEHFSKIQQINSEQISSKCQELEKVRHSYEKIIKENSDMKRKISDYEQQTMKMEEIHKKLLDEKNHKFEIVVANLQKENKNLQKEIERNLFHHSDKEETHQKHLNEKITKLETERENLNQIKEKLEKDLQNIRTMFQKAVHNHKALCEIIKNYKSKAEKDEKELSALLNENQKLKIRAGVSWDEMTPRPSFENLIRITGLEKKILKPTSSRNIVGFLEDFMKKKMQTQNAVKFHRSQTVREETSSSNNIKPKAQGVGRIKSKMFTLLPSPKV